MEVAAVNLEAMGALARGAGMAVGGRGRGLGGRGDRCHGGGARVVSRVVAKMATAGIVAARDLLHAPLCPKQPIGALRSLSVFCAGAVAERRDAGV